MRAHSPLRGALFAVLPFAAIVASSHGHLRGASLGPRCGISLFLFLAGAAPRTFGAVLVFTAAAVATVLGPAHWVDVLRLTPSEAVAGHRPLHPHDVRIEGPLETATAAYPGAAPLHILGPVQVEEVVRARSWVPAPSLESATTLISAGPKLRESEPPGAASVSYTHLTLPTIYSV